MRIGADVGGTFTDIVVVDAEGRMRAHKIPSTPEAFDVAVMQGARAAAATLDADLSRVTDFRHGTTVATNAVLEHTGPATALVTTAGFRDVLELGRLRTPALYDLHWRKPPPLVPRRHRLEVDERTGPDGSALREPRLGALRPFLERAVSAGVTTVAVSLLNAYANPEHERRVAAWIGDQFPQLDVTVATDVVREIGEYERTSTAVLNAYLRPVASAYLGRLEASLSERGCPAQVLVMQSSGGMTPVSDAARFPAHILESGPAAGVLAAAACAAAAGLPKAVSFDMGGTTAKASLIEDFTVTFATEFSVGSDVSGASQLLKGGGYTVHLPVVDLAEVGAGGGSVIRVDGGGGLGVGPGSAGASPGPACYGRGGDQPTVTDANLLLGYLDADALRAAGITVDSHAARQAIDRHVAAPLGISVLQAALAIHAGADRMMARALRAVTTERGRDIRDHALIAFGGSGPLHAATLADSVGVRTVVIPPLAGVYSAVGLLTAPVEMTRSRTVALTVRADELPAFRSALNGARAAALDRFAAAGLQPSAAEVRQIVDLRYRGQASELSLPVSAEPEPEEVRGLAGQFHHLHKRTYGHRMDMPVEIVRVRTVVSRGSAAMPPPAGITPGGPPSRQASFGDERADIPIVSRAQLTGTRPGPLFVDDPDTTVVVPPGWQVTATADGTLRLERHR